MNLCGLGFPTFALLSFSHRSLVVVWYLLQTSTCPCAQRMLTLLSASRTGPERLGQSAQPLHLASGLSTGMNTEPAGPRRCGREALFPSTFPFLSAPPQEILLHGKDSENWAEDRASIRELVKLRTAEKQSQGPDRVVKPLAQTVPRPWTMQAQSQHTPLLT